MRMIECKRCKANIAEVCKQCPKCDYTGNKRLDRNQSAAPLFVVALLVIGCGFVFFSPSKANIASKESERESREKVASASMLCERWVKMQAAFPSTVDYSSIMSFTGKMLPDGNASISTQATMKNAFGLELTYNIYCQVTPAGIVTGSITEAR